MLFLYFVDRQDRWVPTERWVLSLERSLSDMSSTMVCELNGWCRKTPLWRVVGGVGKRRERSEGMDMSWVQYR